MKQAILAFVLTMAAGGAFANGGLSIDTVKQIDIKLPAVEIDRSDLTQGSIENFEAYTGRMVVVDSEALKHGRDA